MRTILLAFAMTFGFDAALRAQPPGPQQQYDPDISLDLRGDPFSRFLKIFSCKTRNRRLDRLENNAKLNPNAEERSSELAEIQKLRDRLRGYRCMTDNDEEA